MITYDDVNKKALEYTGAARKCQAARHKLAATIGADESDIASHPEKYASQYAEFGNAYREIKAAKKAVDDIRAQYQQEQKTKASTPKQSTPEQKKQDSDKLKDNKKTTTKQEKKTEAQKEEQKNDSTDEKLKEAEKRKASKDKAKTAIEESAKKAQKDVENLFKDLTSDSSIKDLKNDIKDAIFDKDKSLEKITGSYKKAEKEVKKVLSQAKDIQNLLKDPKKGIQEVALKVLSNEGLLKLQQSILSGKLTEALTLDNIVKKVTEYMGDAKNIFKSVTEKLAAKKAYISAFISNTFGNPEYMEKLKATIDKKVQDTLKNLAYEKLNDYMGKLDAKVNSVFSKVDSKLNQLTGKIYTKIDTLTKLVSLENINKKLQGVLSLDALQKKLNSFPLGKIFSGPIMNIAGAAKTKVLSLLKTEKFQKVFGKVTSAFQKITGALNKAKDFIKQKTQMIRDYVNQLKDKAMNAIKEYATKIISDIASKISISGALGGLGF